MKKVIKYFFAVIAMMFVCFAVNNQDVKALDKVVINADANGNAQGIYEIKIPVKNDDPEDEEGKTEYITEYKQFTNTRDITITINIDEEALSEYDKMFDICEIIPENNADNVRKLEICSSYATKYKNHNFQLSGRHDGEKEIKVYFYSNYVNKAVSSEIVKAIVLDTTGPSIDITGGEYLFITLGNSYEEAGATCDDDSLVKIEGGCKVEIEEKDIDMGKSGYQYVRYTATDFLGNTVIVRRKVMVEVAKKEEGLDLYWYVAGVVVIVVAGALVVKVIKNKDKQKNESVL